MAETIAVTGAGGFVGSAVVRHLADRFRFQPVGVAGRRTTANRVVALLRPGGSLARLAELRPSEAWSVREVDLQRPEDVTRVVKSIRPVAVVHTALDRTVYQDDSETQREHLVAAPLRNVVRALAESGGLRFVHTGSSWVLPCGWHLAEDAQPAATVPYARAKLLEDHILPELAAEYGLQWINLRLFNLFGRYERTERLIPYLVDRLSRRRAAELSAGDNVRDFTDVDLAAEAFSRAIEAPADAADSLYHIGTGRGVRIAELAGWVADELDGRELLRFGDRETPDGTMTVQVAAIDRARRALAWSPPDDIETRVKAVAAWWMARRQAVTDRGSIIPP